MRRVNIYKDSLIDAMKDSSEFDKMIIESNDEYIKKLTEADAAEYDILRMNMEKAQTPEERADIRARMTEMNEQRQKKDSENKEFYETQQENHNNYNKVLLASLAAILTGTIYKYRKTIMNAGKTLIEKKM